jgi:hypothetical protein
MSNDFYIDEGTHDLYLVGGSSLRLCDTVQELTRQRIAITLKTYLGEWFANRLFGTPYFQSIFGKRPKATADVAIKGVITSVEGVQEIIYYKSEVNPETRVFTVVFKVLGLSGDIISGEVSI